MGSVIVLLNNFFRDIIFVISCGRFNDVDVVSPRVLTMSTRTEHPREMRSLMHKCAD